jgi:cytidyltransferase-like protein
VTRCEVTRYAAVTGRFQPFHLGHLELVRMAAAQCDRVIIGITNPDPGSWHEHGDSAHRHRPEANPFSYWQRQDMIATTLTAARDEGWMPAGGWTIVPFPLDRPDVWFDYIPHDAVQFVRAFSDWERSKAHALREGGYEVVLFEEPPEAAVRASAIREAWSRGDTDVALLPEVIRHTAQQTWDSVTAPVTP